MSNYEGIIVNMACYIKYILYCIFSYNSGVDCSFLFQYTTFLSYSKEALWHLWLVFGFFNFQCPDFLFGTIVKGNKCFLNTIAVILEQWL